MTEFVRIFVSSPSDVPAERIAVDRVARRVSAQFEGVEIKVTRWESGRYYSAHTGFQEQIDEIGGFDLVVGILWSRLGTPLPPGFGPGMPAPRAGQPYPSGTAFEVLEAIRLRKERASPPPEILVYRKLAPTPSAKADDDAAQEELLIQRRAVNEFFRDFFANETDGYKGAFQTFDDLDGFEARFEQDLIAWLRDDGRLGRQRRWRIEDPERGCPFVGLNAFGAKHRDVFFGRRADIERARERLDSGNGFLLIDGASGTGKSSLVRAGVLPRLQDLDPDLRIAVTVPETADPFAVLAQALFDKAALPELAQSDYPDPAALARHFAGGGDASPVLRALDRAAMALVDAERRDSPSDLHLVLVVDQFEAFFTARVPLEARATYAALLAELVASGRVRVIATLRANAREAALELPVLGRLINGQMGLSLEPPGPDAMAEIIRGPAEAAAIAFERDANGFGLDEVLLREVEQDSAALPLLQFALEKLYEAAVKRVSDAGAKLGDVPVEAPVLTLTHADYHAFGGLAGAIGHQAEAALKGCSGAAQSRLAPLVRSLTEAGSGAFVLARAPLALAAPDAETQELAEALTAARIIVQSSERDGNTGRSVPTLRFSHERVLTAWDRVRNAARAAENYLRTRADLIRAEARWRQADRKSDLLLPSGSRLAEAEDAVRDFGPELDRQDPRLRAYVQNSGRHDRRQQRLTQAAAVIFAVVALAAGWFAYQSDQNAQMAVEAAGEARSRQSQALTQISQARFNQRELGEALAFALAAWPKADEALEPSLATWEALRDASRDFREISRVSFLPVEARIGSFAGDLLAEARLRDYREGKNLPNETGSPWVLAFSPALDRFAVYTSHGAIQIFRVSDGQLETSIALEDRVVKLTWSGSIIAARTINNTVLLWNSEEATTVELLYSLPNAPGAWLSNEGTLLAVKINGAIEVRNVASQDIVCRLSDEDFIGVSFSPDETRALIYDKHDVSIYRINGCILERNAPRGSVISDYIVNQDAETITVPATDLGLKEDLQFDERLTAAFGIVGINEDGVVIERKSLHLLETRVLRRLALSSGLPSDRVDACWSKSNLASLHGGSLSVRNISSGEILVNYDRFLDEGFTQFAFSNDCSIFVASESDEIVVYDDRFTPVLKLEVPSGDKIVAIDISRDKSRLVVGTNGGKIFEWDLNVGAITTEFVGHQYAILDIAYSPENKIVSHSLDGTVRLWRTYGYTIAQLDAAHGLSRDLGSGFVGVADLGLSLHIDDCDDCGVTRRIWSKYRKGTQHPRSFLTSKSVDQVMRAGPDSLLEAFGCPAGTTSMSFLDDGAVLDRVSLRGNILPDINIGQQVLDINIGQQVLEGLGVAGPWSCLAWHSRHGNFLVALTDVGFRGTSLIAESSFEVPFASVEQVRGIGASEDGTVIVALVGPSEAIAIDVGGGRFLSEELRCPDPIASIVVGKGGNLIALNTEAGAPCLFQRGEGFSYKALGVEHRMTVLDIAPSGSGYLAWFKDPFAISKAARDEALESSWLKRRWVSEDSGFNVFVKMSDPAENDELVVLFGRQETIDNLIISEDEKMIFGTSPFRVVSYSTEDGMPQVEYLLPRLIGGIFDGDTVFVGRRQLLIFDEVSYYGSLDFPDKRDLRMATEGGSLDLTDYVRSNFVRYNFIFSPDFSVVDQSSLFDRVCSLIGDAFTTPQSRADVEVFKAGNACDPTVRLKPPNWSAWQPQEIDDGFADSLVIPISARR